jgi:hypothetical protein
MVLHSNVHFQFSKCIDVKLISDSHYDYIRREIVTTK